MSYINAVSKNKAMGCLPNGAELISFDLIPAVRRQTKMNYQDLVVIYKYKNETYRTIISSHSGGEIERKHK